jgi:hypothetical protein
VVNSRSDTIYIVLAAAFLAACCVVMIQRANARYSEQQEKFERAWSDLGETIQEALRR